MSKKHENNPSKNSEEIELTLNSETIQNFKPTRLSTMVNQFNNKSNHFNQPKSDINGQMANCFNSSSLRPKTDNFTQLDRNKNGNRFFETNKPDFQTESICMKSAWNMDSVTPSDDKKFETAKKDKRDAEKVKKAVHVGDLKSKYRPDVQIKSLMDRKSSYFEKNELTDPQLDLFLNGLYTELSKIDKSKFLVEIDKKEAEIDCKGLSDSLVDLFVALEDSPKLFLSSLTYTTNLVFKTNFKHLRIINYKSPTDFSALSSDKIHKFIVVSGIILKIGSPLLLVNSMEFKCSECGNASRKTFKDYMYEFPKKCSGEGCMGRNFIPLKSTVEGTVAQRLKLQEQVGRNPGILVAEIYGMAVGTVKTGDSVVLSGILKPETLDKEELFWNQKGANQGLFSTYMSVNSITRESNNVLEGFRSLISSELCFEALIAYLCPIIKENELAKALIVLSLVSSSSNLHILLLGGPGSGKSTLLDFIESISSRKAQNRHLELFPKTHRELYGELSIEPGRIALCNNGVCCIDDLHDIKVTDQGRLVDILDNRRLIIGKSAGFACLEANVLVIATTTVKKDGYDSLLGIEPNIRINRGLLSQFALTVMLSSNQSYFLSNVSARLFNKQRIVAEPSLEDINQRGFSTYILKRRQELDIIDKFSQLNDIKVFGNLIEYTKRQREPRLGQEIAKYIREFYMELREEYKAFSKEINIKVFWSIIELIKSRAKIDGKKEVSLQDANEVIEITKEMYNSLYSKDNKNLLQPKKVGEKTNNELSMPKKQRLFINFIKGLAEDLGRYLFEYDELKSIEKELKLEIEDFQLFVERLNYSGIFLKKDQNSYELQK